VESLKQSEKNRPMSVLEVWKCLTMVRHNLLNTSSGIFPSCRLNVIKITAFQNLVLLPSSGEMRTRKLTCWAHTRASLKSGLTVDWKRSNFRKLVVLTTSRVQTMDKDQKSNLTLFLLYPNGSKYPGYRKFSRLLFGSNIDLINY
jgi:hypothetical protein